MEKKAEANIPQVISFLSGKGGAGKTSVSISVAHLLNDVGFKVLLIDFDFATNGASYFFKHLFQRNPQILGLTDLIRKDLSKIPDWSEFGLEIQKNLFFLPSRVSFSKKVPLQHSLYANEEELQKFLSQIKHDASLYFDFIILDNQAGSNVTSKVSASLSDKVILIAELDPISNDAIDNLLIQIGDSFPEYKRHLINKLDIRESDGYKNLNLLFQSMNRLPPLPFDFEVRAAFSSRQIPIDVNKPTTFLIALFNMVKSMLPEYQTELNEYGQKILKRFSEYQARVDGLLNSKESNEKELELIRSSWYKTEDMSKRLFAFFGIGGGIIISILSVIGFDLFGDTKNIFAVIGLLISFVSLIFVYFVFKQDKEKFQDIERVERINSNLENINKEIDMYKSFMLTRTREFLMNFEQK